MRWVGATLVAQKRRLKPPLPRVLLGDMAEPDYGDILLLHRMPESLPGWKEEKCRMKMLQKWYIGNRRPGGEMRRTVWTKMME